jgi:hypothetical protein
MAIASPPLLHEGLYVFIWPNQWFVMIYVVESVVLEGLCGRDCGS